MTPEEIQAMAKGLAQGQAVWYVVSACIGGAMAGLGTYLAEKGKNRATKEDIADITKKVKEVEDVFNRGLSDLSAHHQLRLVAAERRMLAHQHAYRLWSAIGGAMFQQNREKVRELDEELTEWYQENFIFLAINSRAAFLKMWEVQQRYINDQSPPSTAKAERYISDMKSFGNVFLVDIDLPELKSPGLVAQT